jgi:hypothetical protein
MKTQGTSLEGIENSQPPKLRTIAQFSKLYSWTMAKANECAD